jgi:hypothetical protein
MTIDEHEQALRSEGRLDAVRDAQAEVREKHEAHARELASHEAPIIRDLRSVGVVVKSVWELVNTSREYSAALPVLLEHLQREYPPAIIEGMARAMAVPEAHFAWNVLTGLFRTRRDKQAREGLAVALAGAASEHSLGDVISLLRDRALGRSRVHLLRALERTGDPKAENVLIELSDDADVGEEASAALKRKRRGRRADSSAGPPRTTSQGDLGESECPSIGLDSINVAAFLRRVSALVESGFGEAEIRQVTELASGLVVGGGDEIAFGLTAHGRPMVMKLRLRKSDEDALELTIVAPAVLARKIEEEMLRTLEL